MANGETDSFRRASLGDAREFISQSRDVGGRARGLRTLEAAFDCYDLIHLTSSKGPSIMKGKGVPSSTKAESECEASVQ